MAVRQGKPIPHFDERLAGKIFIWMAEAEAERVWAQEKDIIRRSDRASLLHLAAAVVVALSGFGLAAFVSQKDPRAAAVIAGGDLMVMVGGFLGPSHLRRKRQDEYENQG